MTVFYVLISILFLGFFIFFHELFHLLAAKTLNIKASEFAVGFGPTLARYQKGVGFQLFPRIGRETPRSDNIVYYLKLIPLGGYVNFGKPLGDANAMLEDGLYQHKPWKRIVVAFAGPLGNLLLAVVLFACFLVFYSVVGSKGMPVANVIAGSPAQKLGIQVGDTITKVNKIKYPSYDVFSSSIHNGRPFCLGVLKKGEASSRSVCASLPKDSKLGVQLTVNLYAQDVNALNLIPKSVNGTYGISKMYLSFMIDKILKLDVKEFSGPIGIVDTMQKNITDYTSFLTILISINIALAFSNLILPFSITDGGRIVTDLIAILFKKQRIKTFYLDVASLCLVMAIFAASTYHDIARILQ